MSETRTNATQQIIVLLQRVGYLEGDIESAARDGGGSMREYALDVLKPGEVPEPDLVDWEAVADSFDRRVFDPLGPAVTQRTFAARYVVAFLTKREAELVEAFVQFPTRNAEAIHGYEEATGRVVSADDLASLNMAVAALDKAVAIFEAGE